MDTLIVSFPTQISQVGKLADGATSPSIDNIKGLEERHLGG